MASESVERFAGKTYSGGRCMLPLVIPSIAFLSLCFRLIRGYRVRDGWEKSKVVWSKCANRRLFGMGERA